MKDTIFYKNNTLNCRGKLLNLDQPIVMGILNVTPDSFYDGGKFSTNKKIISRVEQMLEEGAAIIDVGGYSTRPDATDISEKEESNRLIPVIKSIHKEFPNANISADTFRSDVATQAIEAGACIINDISGGAIDKNMFETIAQLQVPYILMHIQGTPQTMQNNPDYKNVMKEIIQYFSEKVYLLRQSGVHDIILDPGFGFGKSLEHNYEILKKLANFKIFELPIMVGISRKSMLNKVIHTSPETALNGTSVAHTVALMNGANIIRVHDVKEAKEAIDIVNIEKLYDYSTIQILD